MATTDRRGRAARLGRSLAVGVAVTALTLATGAVAAQGPPPPAPTPVVVVELTDGQILAERTTFEVGRPYGFAPINLGSGRHGLVIKRRGMAAKQPLAQGDRLAEVAPLAPGIAGALTWTFAEPGASQLACRGPAHGASYLALPIEVTG